MDRIKMSGCPIFRWYTVFPAFLAASAYGTNLRIGDAGISMAFKANEGMSVVLVSKNNQSFFCGFFYFVAKILYIR